MLDRFIIGLIGEPGSGRNIIASHLEKRHGFRPISFSDPIDDMLRAGLGISKAQLDGDGSNVPLPSCGGLTGRELKRSLGYAWGRQGVDAALWVNAWRSRMLAHKADAIVVDAIHFPNEADAIRSMSGWLWRVVRDGYKSHCDARSRLEDSIRCDVVIENTGSIAQILKRADQLLALSGQRERVTLR